MMRRRVVWLLALATGLAGCRSVDECYEAMVGRLEAYMAAGTIASPRVELATIKRDRACGDPDGRTWQKAEKRLDEWIDLVDPP